MLNLKGLILIIVLMQKAESDNYVKLYMVIGFESVPFNS